MQVEYTGRQVTVTPALRVIAEESWNASAGF